MLKFVLALLLGFALIGCDSDPTSVEDPGFDVGGHWWLEYYIEDSLGEGHPPIIYGFFYLRETGGSQYEGTGFLGDPRQHVSPYELSVEGEIEGESFRFWLNADPEEGLPFDDAEMLVHPVHDEMMRGVWVDASYIDIVLTREARYFFPGSPSGG